MRKTANVPLRRTRSAKWSAGIVAAFTLGCGSLNCSNQSSTPGRESARPPVRQASHVDASLEASSVEPSASAKRRPDSPQVRLKAAAITPLVERPTLRKDALVARLVAQQKLLSDDPLLEDALGERVAVEAPPYEAPESAVEKDVERVDGDEDESGTGATSSDGASARPLTSLLASASQSLDNLDNLPGSAGVLAEPAIIERIDGNSLGLYLPFEDPSGTALDAFFGALQDLREAPRDARGVARKVRIAAYGASHTQADIYTDYIRTYLQSRFGNGGHGYVSLVRTNRWYRHTDFSVDNSRGWIVDRIQKRGSLDDGHYGLLGSSARARRARNYAKISPRHPNDPKTAGDQYVVSFLKQPRGGHFLLFADGKQIAKVRTSGRKKEPDFHRFELPLGNHEIEVKPVGNGEVRVFGVTIERDEPGVVVDTLGLSGTRASNQLQWDEDTWRISLQQRQPALYILAFGTNEATDSHQPIEHYAEQLREVLNRFKRAAPQASCLLAGPGDFAQKIDEETWRQVPRLLEIIRVQREVATEYKCAYWDALQFMGGGGTIALWSNSYPQMASRDHIHLTRRGYVRMGMNLVDALMIPYDERFPSVPLPGTPAPVLTQSP